MNTIASASSLAPVRTGSKVLNASLWAAQIVLAATFLLGGFMKTTLPIDVLTAKMVWPGALPEGLVRFIGAAELAGAVALLLPAITRIKPFLTPIAAAGLVLVLALAVPFHLFRGEAPALALILPLGVLAVFVAWGRLKKVPIRARR